MQTAAQPMPKRTKRRWVFVGGFVLSLLATPFVLQWLANTLADRELEQIYREIDAEDPNWRWADLVKQLPPVPPDERNAMVQLQKVIRLNKATPFAMPFGSNRLKPINARLKDTDEQRLRASLAALAPKVLEEARKLKDMPEGRLVIDPAVDPWHGEFGALQTLRIMQILEHDAMLHSQGGKPEDAADACLAIAHSTRALGDVPAFMGQLVRMAGQIHAVAAIERTLGQGIVEEKKLEAIHAALVVEAKQNGVLHALRGERAFLHERYLEVRDGKISAEKFIRDTRLNRTMTGKLYSLFPSTLLRGYPDALRWQNEMLRASKLKDEAQIEAFSKIQETKLDPANPWTGSGSFLFGQIKDLRSDHTRTRCAVAAIAAERYRLKYEQWPTGIAELVKDGLLKEPITDPFDGQPLRIQRSDTGLIVYSVGADKIDGQGKSDDIRFELWLPAFRATAPAAEVEAPKVKRR